MLHTPLCDRLGIAVPLVVAPFAIHPEWKERICRAADVDAVKVPHAERVMPLFTLPQLGRPMAPRSLRTALVDRLEIDPDSVDPATIGPELLAAVRAGAGHELLPFTGQSVALVHDILSAAELVTRLACEAEEALSRAGGWVRHGDS